MSYINFSITHRFEAGAASIVPRTETTSAGFSREGGKVEFVKQSTSDTGPMPPRTFEARLTGVVMPAARGVLEAVQGAGWVQDVLVQHGDGGQPDPVSWTYRNGGSGSGLAGSLPAPVQQVLDAAKVLERATTAQLVYDGA